MDNKSNTFPHDISSSAKSAVSNASISRQANNVKQSVSSLASSSRSRISEEFHNFLADIEELITQTTSLSGEDLARAKEKLNERVEMARESLDDMGGVIAQRARQTAAATDNYVRDQPWTAIGIGAALGVILGVVLARRQ
ncbi:MAG: DUF883 domain-containing protein [Gammaproteobacteria bacterium]|nr:DUF883 domain-containing protein [Gammaproteobacteria bacterium]